MQHKSLGKVNLRFEYFGDNRKDENVSIPARIDKEKSRILIVDDTPANLRLLTTILNNQGYIVHPTNNGEHAIRFLQTNLPDLILLDVKMPGLNGYQLCEQLKNDDRTRDIPIIFISAADEVSDKVKAFSLGGVDYIVKPIQGEEVLARVSTHLSLRELHKKLEISAQRRTAELVTINARLDEEIIERRRSEAFHAGQGHILEMIATGSSLEEIMESLTGVIESQIDGLMSCVTLLDDDDTQIRRVISMSLPAEFKKAIGNMRVGPEGGSCGTAMHKRESVVVDDILKDPLWNDYREPAMRHGLRACWSMPILSHQGNPLGTIAVYAKEVRVPSAAETRLIGLATRIAGIAIERKQTEEHIRHMTHHDVLTGLPNRAFLDDRLTQAILYAQRYGRSATVAFVDLDNFKLINDSLGYNAGDELLRVVADRLAQCVRRTDTVVRLGGDAFVVVLFDQTEKADVITPTLQKIRDAIGQAVEVSGRKLHITCSIGLSTYPTDGEDTKTLLRNADAAMHRAKELGGDNFQFYTAELNTTIHERLSLQEGLRNAIDRDEFPLLYQPQLDLRSGEITGVEALIRWQHPELGLVSPAQFIPLAEETGLIVPIGEWVLRTACKQNKAWQDAGMAPITMSVNVSARQFMEKDLVNRVAAALKESGLEAKYLELELTESLIMRDVDQAIATMRELQAMGIHLSIDDFGTGYSSLSALKHFPIVRLKIDQSFVRNIPSDHDDKAIASAMVALAHRLDLKVIAEGVESEEQLTFLRDNNCDEVQGYHFSKPITASEVELLLLQTPEQRRKNSKKK